MFRRILTAIAVIFTAAFASASTHTVSGRIVDSADSEPLPGALCRLYTESDTTAAVSEKTSAADGKFSLSARKSGNYLLKVSYIGMATRSVPVTVSTGSVDLGDVVLSGDSELLGEVDVVARKPVIQANGERVTYNVQEDPTSGNSSVIEMLRKVPLVTVDAQDNIQVNGQSSFKIYVNGKENPMMSANPKEVLKAMPASAIAKIEVITEPGAKYDAEGTGGILNIVTATGSSATDGYLATVRTSVDNLRWGAGIYGMFQKDKVAASVNYNYNRQYSSPEFHIDNDRANWDAEYPESVSHTLSSGKAKNHHSFHNASLDLSWEPDTLNLFNITGSLFSGSGDNRMPYHQMLLDPQGAMLWQFTQNSQSSWDWGSFSAGASYQHTFRSSKEHTLVWSYLYDHGTNSSASTVDYTETVNFPIPAYALTNRSHNPTNSHTLQLDYTLPVAAKHKIETGAKAIFRRNRSTGVSVWKSDTGDAVAASGQDISLRQYQDVAAAYASYSGIYARWSVKAGLRYEYTHMGVDFLNHSMPDFGKSLNDLVPNAAIAYQIRPASSLRLAYQMRISRPTVSQLNPYRDESNLLSVEYGNPNLTSERCNTLTLTYTNFTDLVGANISLSYYRNNNSIANFSYSEGAVQYSTYSNTGVLQNTDLNAYLNFNFSKRLTMSFYGSVSYADLNYRDMHTRNSGWGYYAMLNLNYTMPAEIRLSGYGGYGRQTPELQADNGRFYYYSLSLSRAFLREKRLEVSLNASNFFAPMRMTARSWTSTSYNTSHYQIPGQSFGVSVSYRFGALNSSVKKTAAAIVNDDIQSTSAPSSSPGQGNN